MKRFDSKRKGFTLVELLIVIVVIGILSAMMMLSSSEAVSSARATTIVADLRNIKTAALAYYADNLDTDFPSSPSSGTSGTSTPSSGFTMANIVPYLTTAKTADELTTAGYSLVADNNSWFVKCEVKGTNVEKIKEKLEGRAKSTGLLGATTGTTEGSNSTSTTTYAVYKKTDNACYMLIR